MKKFFFLLSCVPLLLSHITFAQTQCTDHDDCPDGFQCDYAQQECVEIADEDDDGILDSQDQCLGTQPVDGGLFVDTNGCSCDQKECLDGFECIHVFVEDLNNQNQRVTNLRARCIEQSDTPAYDLHKAMKEVQGVNQDDPNYIAVLPEHLVGADDKSLRGDASDITTLFQRFANGLTLLAGAIAVLFLIINGFVMVTSAGNTDQIGKAKKGLMWSVIGLLLIIMSYVIVKTVVGITYSGQDFEEGAQRTTSIVQSAQDNKLKNEKRIQEIENEIDMLEGGLDLLETKKDGHEAALFQQNLSPSQKLNAESQLAEIEKDIEAQEQAIEDLEDELDDLEDANDMYEDIIDDQEKYEGVYD